MKEWVKKYQIIIILAVLAGLMSAIKLTYKYDPSRDQATIPTPLLTATPTATVTEAPITPEEASQGGGRTYESDYPLWSLLPHQGKGFEADRYLAPRKLAVKARGVDKKIAKEEVEKWLEANGVEPGSHEIVFVN